MPGTAEHDTELLEAYLDDALDDRDVVPLRARLASEPELLASLDALREERALRRALFTALEPDGATIDTLAARLRRATQSPAQPAAWLRPLRYTAAAAACVAAGFFVRPLLDRGPTNPGAATHQVARQNKIVDLQKIDAYQVTLRDDAGRVVAVQRFDSLDKAQEFAADLARWQGRSDRLASSQFVVTNDRF